MNLSPILIWFAEQLFAYAFGRLMKHKGWDDAKAHAIKAIDDAKPLPEDLLPSPAAQRRPKQYTDS